MMARQRRVLRRGQTSHNCCFEVYMETAEDDEWKSENLKVGRPVKATVDLQVKDAKGSEGRGDNRMRCLRDRMLRT